MVCEFGMSSLGPLAFRKPTNGWDAERPTVRSEDTARRVEDVGPVRRRHHHDPLTHDEPVHLDEQLVERLLALLVAPHFNDELPPRRPFIV
jgi:hypothetical protein